MKNQMMPVVNYLKASVLLMLLLSCSLGVTFGQEKRVESDVKSVKVYFKGAEVFRVAKTMLPKGSTLLIFENVADEIDASSIQFAASKGVDVLSVSHQVDGAKSLTENGAIKRMKDSIDLLNDFVKAIEIQNSVMTNEESILKLNYNTGGTQNGVNSVELQKILEINRKRLTEIQTAKYDNAKKITEAKKRIDQLNVNIDKERAGLPTGRGEIRVLVNSAMPLAANFEFKYFTNVAGWVPTYDIKTEGPLSNVKLIYKAEVAQNTGEIWDNVKLTLSSANPKIGIDLPILNNEYIGFEPKPRKVSSVYSSDRRLYMKNSITAGAPTMAFEMQDMGGGMNKPVQGTLDATFNANEVVFEFEIPMPYSIPNDGQGKIVSLKEYEMKMRYEYFAIPKVDASVYLTGLTNDWKQLNILPGFANMFYGDNFTGKTFLNPTAKDDSLRFSFGRDKRILIERKLLNDFSKHNFFGTSKKQTYTYEFTLNNTQNVDVAIRFIDQIPISKEEQIQVETEDLSGGNINPNSGFVEWKLTLKANENRKLKFVYNIVAPKSREVFRN
ncbi:MAG: DUF4139 domain-containing protein [Bacteroidia bacterium]|nr:DUF4139 domain-containing protein [Bacteroidia bacterium]